jgi:hypothetical protein
VSELDPIGAIEKHLSNLSHASPRFDEDERLAALDVALAACTPAHLFVRRARKGVKTTMVELAFAMGHGGATQRVVARAAMAHPDLRAGGLFVPSFHAWRDARLEEGVALWRSLLPPGTQVSQSQWLHAARDAFHNQHPACLTWITQQPGFWGSNAQEALDAVTTLATHPSPTPSMRAAAVEAIGRGWAYTEGSDPRLSHKPAVWAMGIARLGWKPPTHTRAKPLSTIQERIRTAHAILHFSTSVGSWESWVGHHEADVEKRLLAITGEDPKPIRAG